jgi:hypothetical protein
MREVLSISILFLTLGLNGQVTIGTAVTVKSDATIVVGEAVSISNGGSVINNGNIELRNSLENNGVFQGTSGSYLRFNGSQEQVLSGGNLLSLVEGSTVELDNSLGLKLETILELKGALVLSNGVVNTNGYGIELDLTTSSIASNENTFIDNIVYLNGSPSSAYQVPLGSSGVKRELIIHSNSSESSLVQYNHDLTSFNSLSDSIDIINPEGYWLVLNADNLTIEYIPTVDADNGWLGASSFDEIRAKGAFAYGDNGIWELANNEGTSFKVSDELNSASVRLTLAKRISPAPGGVDAGLEMWLKADDGYLETSPYVLQSGDDLSRYDLSTGETVERITGVWQDANKLYDFVSEYSALDATPFWLERGINYNRTVFFNNLEDQLVSLSDYSLGVRSFFVVYRHFSSGDYETVFDSKSASDFLFPGGESDGLFDQASLGASVSDGVLRKNGATHSVAAQRDTLVSIYSRVLTETFDSEVPWAIGIGASISSSIKSDDSFSGDVAEIISYSAELSSGEIERVESYLAIKYGVTQPKYVSSSGQVIFDESLSNGYDQDIVIIGRDDDSGLMQKQSVSEGVNNILVVAIDDEVDGIDYSNAQNSNTFATNESFLVVASDGASLDGTGNTELDKSMVKSRMAREWLVQEVGDVGSVTLEFDISEVPSINGIGGNDENQVVLLIDADGDFSEGASTVLQSLVTPNDDKVVFRADLQNGTYLTLASSEEYALPITLLAFNATAQLGGVRLFWTTTNEINHSHFIIERSPDGIHFEPIIEDVNPLVAREKGVNKYESLDASPLPGVNYYRLVDVSNSGNKSFSGVVAVLFEENLEVSLLNNPVLRGKPLSVLFKGVDSFSQPLAQFSITSMNGVVVSQSQTDLTNSRVVELETNELAQGVYLLHVVAEGIRRTLKFIIYE